MNELVEQKNTRTDLETQIHLRTEPFGDKATPGGCLLLLILLLLLLLLLWSLNNFVEALATGRGNGRGRDAVLALGCGSGSRSDGGKDAALDLAAL